MVAIGRTKARFQSPVSKPEILSETLNLSAHSTAVPDVWAPPETLVLVQA